MPQTGYKNIYYRYKRFFVFSVITLFALIIPYITINGNHFFLLSFERKQLHLLFASFATPELFLMPFVLIFLFLSFLLRLWVGEFGVAGAVHRRFSARFIAT